ncbi:MAG: mannosyltransferase, partial [Sphaerisporangium sp.]|nr:mannosyltransferase [Sphaerisporangium sp.]
VLALCYPRFLPWLAPVTMGLCAVALVLLGAARLARAARPAMAVGMAVGMATGVASVLVAPGAWSVSALDPRYSEAGGMGRVGPTSRQASDKPVEGLSSHQRSLLAYVKAHRAGAKYLFAVDRWYDASPYILSTGVSILPMGGYTGQVPFPTLSQFSRLVTAGQLHYVLSRADRHAGGSPGSTTAHVMSWVRSRCTLVPESSYGGPLLPYRPGHTVRGLLTAGPNWELRRC